MRKLLILIAPALIAGPLVAEDHLYVGPQLTYQLWDENRFISEMDDDNDLQLGLNLGYEFAGRYAAEISTLNNLSDGDAKSLEVNLYNYFSSDRNSATPYLVVGLSKLSMDSALILDEDTNNIALGLGVSRYLGDFVELKTDVRFFNAFGGAVGGDDVLDIGFRMALNYHFGRSGQADLALPSIVIPAQIPVAVQAPETVAEVVLEPAAPQMRTITVELDVLFANNSSVLENLDTEEFSSMADALRAQPNAMLTIEGHTDSKGTEEYNQFLSQRRADSVRQELISEYGAPANRTSAVGYGESRPIADNSTSEGMAQNRRVVGVLSYEVAQ